MGNQGQHGEDQEPGHGGCRAAQGKASESGRIVVAEIGLAPAVLARHAAQQAETQFPQRRNAMQKTLIALTIAAVAAVTAFSPTNNARAQKSSVPADVMKELAPTGKLRAGINLGNSVLAQKSASGELGGISVELARELGKRLGVPVELVEFQAAGRSFEAMGKGQTDVAFFAIEPVRAAEVTFSPPYAVIDGAYMVAKDSPLKT